MLGPPGLLDRIAEAIVSRDAHDLANLAGLDEVADGHADGQVAGPDGLHEEEAGCAGRVGQDAGLGGVDGEGLFAEDMLAGAQGEHDIVEVVRVRRGDVDDVDVGVCDEGLVRAVSGAGRGDAGVRDEALRAVRGRRRRHGGHGVCDVAGVALGWVDEKVFDEDCAVCQISVLCLSCLSGIPLAILPVAGSVSRVQSELSQPYTYP
jgi:hypothetical protein